MEAWAHAGFMRWSGKLTDHAAGHLKQNWEFDPSKRSFSQVPFISHWLRQEQPRLGRIFFPGAILRLSREAGQAYGPLVQKFLLEDHNRFGEKRPER